MARLGGMHLVRQTLRVVLQRPVLSGAGGAKACAVIGTRTPTVPSSQLIQTWRKCNLPHPTLHL